MTYTHNLIYITLTNYTNKRTKPNIITFPSKTTQLTPNKNTRTYQKQKNKENHLKRARPTGLAQNKPTQRKYKDYQHITTNIKKQTHQNYIKDSNSTTSQSYTTNHIKSGNPKPIICTNTPINQTTPSYLAILLNSDTKDLPKTKPSSTNKHTKKIIIISIPNTCIYKSKNTNINPNIQKTQRIRKKCITTHKCATTNKQPIQHGHNNKPIIKLKLPNTKPYLITVPNDQPTTQLRISKNKQERLPISIKQNIINTTPNSKHTHTQNKKHKAKSITHPVTTIN